MKFDYHLESISTDALKIKYFLVPWDTDIFGRAVGQIAHLNVNDVDRAATHYSPFAAWCREQEIFFCSCRLNHDRIKESMFLESQDFRFIELNYRPRLNNLQHLQFDSHDIEVFAAEVPDQELLADIAGETFQHGRFHQDPRIDDDLGNRRYRVWMENAFTHPRQRVLKCVCKERIIGFFVVEYPEPTHCFWSLVGLAPGLQGKGLGKKVWRTMLHWHQAQGVDTISTSITSHNVAVFNLYVSLGFRFPTPQATFHWVRADSSERRR